MTNKIFYKCLSILFIIFIFAIILSIPKELTSKEAICKIYPFLIVSITIFILFLISVLPKDLFLLEEIL